PSSTGDATHPYVMQETGATVAQAPAKNLTPFQPAPKLLPANAGGAAANSSASATAAPVQEVFGFALASSLSDPTLGYPSWNFNQLSTVAFFGLHVNTDGTFANASGMSVWNSSQLTGLRSTAHSHGVRVVLTIIEQAYNSIDTYSGSAGDNGGFFNIPALNPYVDSFMVITYDMEYSNYSSAPSHCPAFCLGPTAPLTTYLYNDTRAVNEYTAALGSGGK